jgi:hypothetical protein
MKVALLRELRLLVSPFLRAMEDPDLLVDFHRDNRPQH